MLRPKVEQQRLFICTRCNQHWFKPTGVHPDRSGMRWCQSNGKEVLMPRTRRSVRVVLTARERSVLLLTLDLLNGRLEKHLVGLDEHAALVKKMRHRRRA